VPSLDPIAERLKNSGRDDVHSYVSCGSYFYIFNCNPTLPSGEKNPFADPRVRRALSMAIDRQTIVSQVTRMNQPVARTFVPVDVFAGYEPPVEAGVTFDPEGARKLLAEAGYPNGQGMPPRLTLLYNTGNAHGPVAQRLANTWAQELGIHFELDAREAVIFGQERKKQNFALARGNWFGDYRDPTTFLTMYQSNDGNNDAKFSSAEYDALLAQAQREVDPVKRMNILQDAERVLLREHPVAPIFHYVEIELFDPNRVRNVYPNMMKDRRIDRIEVVREAEAPGA
jgi:oligopeptide transport system substrate-binding protein